MEFKDAEAKEGPDLASSDNSVAVRHCADHANFIEVFDVIRCKNERRVRRSLKGQTNLGRITGGSVPKSDVKVYQDISENFKNGSNNIAISQPMKSSRSQSLYNARRVAFVLHLHTHIVHVNGEIQEQLTKSQKSFPERHELFHNTLDERIPFHCWETERKRVGRSEGYQLDQKACEIPCRGVQAWNSVS